MQRKADVFLLDIWKSADYIVRRTSRLEMADYLYSEDIRFAVERNFIIIGEAVSNLRRYYPETSIQVDDLPTIVASATS